MSAAMHLLLYDQFCEFEVAVLLSILRDHPLITVGLEDKVYVGEGQLKVSPDVNIMDLDPSDVHLLIIPGGAPFMTYERPELAEQVGRLNSLFKHMQENSRIIAAICGGPEFLANAGVLDGRPMTHGMRDGGNNPHFAACRYIDQDVVIDGRTITAQGYAYVEFAFEVARMFDPDTPAEELREGYEWYKKGKGFEA
jgi:putative intracellular protease/amidase